MSLAATTVHSTPYSGRLAFVPIQRSLLPAQYARLRTLVNRQLDREQFIGGAW